MSSLPPSPGLITSSFFLNQWKIFYLPLVIRWVMMEVKYWTNLIIFLLFLLPIAHQFYLTSHGGQLKKNMNENDKGWVNWKVVEQSSLMWFQVPLRCWKALFYLSKCRASNLCAITSVSRVTQGRSGETMTCLLISNQSHKSSLLV